MSKGGKVRERYKPKTEQNKTKKKKKMTLNNNVIVTRGERKQAEWQADRCREREKQAPY